MAVTLLSSVPLHQQLQPYDERRAARLLATNRLRTAAWTAGTGCALAMLLLAARTAPGGA